MQNNTPLSKKFYKITARNAWDTVSIGPFNSFSEAKAHLEIGWSEKLIQPLTDFEVRKYVEGERI